MFKLAIKSLLARKLRLVLMVFSIVLGVSFVVATFVVTDSLRATFDDLAVNIESKTDLTVRTVQEFGDSTLRPPVDAADVDLVKDTDGVAAVDGFLGVFPVTPIKSDGKNVSRTGPPLLGLNTSNSPELNQLIQVEGRPPVGEGEFNLDIDAAKDDDRVKAVALDLDGFLGGGQTALA